MIWSQKAQNGMTSEKIKKTGWHDREKITAENRWHATRSQKEAQNDEAAKEELGRKDQT